MKFNIERLGDIVDLTRQLAIGLRNLTFADNFRNSKHTIDIPATSEYQVRHSLKNIPSGYIITKQTGNGLVTQGTTEEDENFFYLYNNGAVTVTITVYILK